MKTFQQRLKACQRGGNLTVADLARWFDRPYATMRTWVQSGINPGGGPLDRENATELLVVLEQQIKRGKHFPLKRMPPKDRARHLAGVRTAAFC